MNMGGLAAGGGVIVAVWDFFQKARIQKKIVTVFLFSKISKL